MEIWEGNEEKSGNVSEKKIVSCLVQTTKIQWLTFKQQFISSLKSFMINLGEKSQKMKKEIVNNLFRL